MEKILHLSHSLSEMLAGPLDSAPDARRAAQAATLLAELHEWEQRARMLVHGDARSSGSTPQRLTLHEAARRVLTRAGRPLHVRELGERIRAEGWSHPRSTRARPDQIELQLAARLPRYPDVFERVAPNTFGLVEWQGKARKARAPGVALFRGPGGNTARRVAESDEPYGAPPWRSS